MLLVVLTDWFGWSPSATYLLSRRKTSQSKSLKVKITSCLQFDSCPAGDQEASKHFFNQFLPWISQTYFIF